MRCGNLAHLEAASSDRMFLEDPQIDLPYSFDAITRQWTVYGIVDQGVSLFVGHPSEGPLAIFSIDDYPDHAPPEGESRFERLDDDAFSCRISNNLRIFGEICQFRTISQISLELLKHCPLCPFQRLCHSQAEQEDNLSLLNGVTARVIRQYEKKGIFTVKQ